MLNTLGRDVGDDLGIRLSGVHGLALYALATLFFLRFDEDRLQTKLADLTIADSAKRSGK